MNDDEVKKMAEAHYEYVESVCRKMYIDAFIHGFKHGREDTLAGHEGEGGRLMRNDTLEPELVLKVIEARKLLEAVLKEAHYDNRDTKTLPHLIESLQFIERQNPPEGKELF